KKLRAQLDANGYKDVEMKLIGDVPWSRGSSRDTDITHAGEKATAHMVAAGLRSAPSGNNTASAGPSNALFTGDVPEPTGGYWPSYLWADGEVGEKVGTIRIPMGMGGPGGGGGGRNHAANEYYTIEGLDKTSGMATAEKGVAATIYEYALTTTTDPKPKTR
ncbi:MAG: hypothetical protein IT176_09560, partial [Acidobacteria bacterium]|nr:hypothetical protein [Acidobacteriota bacterium]